MGAQDQNVVCISGRLVRDPELRYTNGGTAVTTVTIASNRRVKKGDKYEDEAGFFDAEFFGKSAERLAENCAKGNRILISGACLVQKSWTGNDGSKHSKVVISGIFNFQRVDFVFGGGADQSGGGEPAQDAAPPTDGATPPINESDIPF